MERLPRELLRLFDRLGSAGDMSVEIDRGVLLFASGEDECSSGGPEVSRDACTDIGGEGDMVCASKRIGL